MRFGLVALLAFAGLSYPAFAQPNDALVGRWVMKADGQIVSIFTVTSNNGKLTLERCRPSGSGITSDLEFGAGDVNYTIICDQLKSTDPAPGMAETRFAVSKTAYDEKMINSLSLEPVTEDVVRLNFVGITFPPIALERVGADAMIAKTLPPGVRLKIDQHWPDNPQIKALFEDDQRARANWSSSIDWNAVAKEDAARRVTVQQLVDQGKLHSANDYYWAAFLFQHGGTPQDYLKAHALAVVAAAKGKPSATWISAATLDRYLQSIGQKQIYGTQTSMKEGEAATQDPYDRGLINDMIRTESGVPTRAEQEKKRAEFDVESQTIEPTKPVKK